MIEGAGEERWRSALRRLGQAAVAFDLADESAFLAEELAAQAWALSGPKRLAFALLVLALADAERQGSTRLPLDGAPFTRRVTRLLRAADLELEPQRAAREIRALCRSDRDFASLIGRPGEDRPLITIGDAVSSHRLFCAERRLVERLAARIEGDPARAEPPGARTGDDHGVAAALADVLARPSMRAGAPILLSDEQRAAVAASAARRLAVVSGGPGTGKTAICAAICRVLVRVGVAPAALALAAPTGKAARRLGASIRAALAALADPTDADRRLADELPEPRTLHRLLGYHSQSGRFRHHRRAPLDAEVVLVDEASMVGLELMDRLVAAVPDRAQLLLFGDADQLPSVSAGAVLRDLIETGERRGFARRLRRSYRVDAADPAGRALIEAAGAVRAGRAPDGLPADPTPPAAAMATWFREQIAPGGTWAALAARRFRFDGAEPAADCAGALAALLDHLERSRVLAVTRRLATGSEALNELLHHRAAAALRAPARLRFLPGEPVVVRENDYERGLFNGESGVVVRAARDGGGSAIELRAVFRAGDTLRSFPLAVLGSRLDRAFALTVHQSQGSEYDHVALVLPAVDLPLATRELVYTALTRARRSIRIVAAPDILRAAIARSAERHSGLAAGLASVPPTA